LKNKSISEAYLDFPLAVYIYRFDLLGLIYVD